MAAASGTFRVLPNLAEDAGFVLCSSFREVARPSSETDGLCRLPGAYLLFPFSALVSTGLCCIATLPGPSVGRWTWADQCLELGRRDFYVTYWSWDVTRILCRSERQSLTFQACEVFLLVHGLSPRTLRQSF